MLQSNHVYHFQLLTSDKVLQTQKLLDAAIFVDGKSTATEAAKLVKNNLQIDFSDQTVLPQLQNIIGSAIVAEAMFIHNFYASRAYQLIFSKCEVGMGYGKHVDSPMMGNPPVRTDLAMTVFLDDPASYDGGELVICNGNAETIYKPAAGEAVIYPCQYLHYVKPVTRGVRRVCVTWFQSSVRSAEQRQILTDLKKVHASLAIKNPQGEETQAVLQTWSNLLRMWAEV